MKTLVVLLLGAAVLLVLIRWSLVTQMTIEEFDVEAQIADIERRQVDRRHSDPAYTPFVDDSILNFPQAVFVRATSVNPPQNEHDPAQGNWSPPQRYDR